MTLPPILRQFVKYCNFGVVGAVASYAVFWLLYHFGVHYLIASAIGYIAYMAFAYIVNRKWTFDSSQHVLGGYILVSGFTLVVATVLLHVLVEELGIWPHVAPLAIMGVTTVLNFVGFRFLLGRKS